MAKITATSITVGRPHNWISTR